MVDDTRRTNNTRPESQPESDANIDLEIQPESDLNIDPEIQQDTQAETKTKTFEDIYEEEMSDESGKTINAKTLFPTVL